MKITEKEGTVNRISFYELQIFRGTCLQPVYVITHDSIMCDMQYIVLHWSNLTCCANRMQGKIRICMVRNLVNLHQNRVRRCKYRH